MVYLFRLIAIFDEDGGGDVDFQEFVSGLSAFSSKGNKEQKLQFAFKVYDIDRDGYISNGELFIVLKMMVGSNLKDQQLQQIVDKTIMEADLDGDGKISFEEFTKMVENTDVSMSMTLGEFPYHTFHAILIWCSPSATRVRRGGCAFCYQTLTSRDRSILGNGKGGNAAKTPRGACFHILNLYGVPAQEGSSKTSQTLICHTLGCWSGFIRLVR